MSLPLKITSKSINESGIEFQLLASTIDIKGNLVQESSNSLAFIYFSSPREGKLNFGQLVFVNNLIVPFMSGFSN